jgi:hypothetical protein
VLERGHANLGRLLGLRAHIDLAGRIVADQDHGHAGLEVEHRNPIGDLAAHACGDGFAIDDAGAHAQSLKTTVL